MGLGAMQQQRNVMRKDGFNRMFRPCPSSTRGMRNHASVQQIFQLACILI
jgi:hypothetical protein